MLTLEHIFWQAFHNGSKPDFNYKGITDEHDTNYAHARDKGSKMTSEEKVKEIGKRLNILLKAYRSYTLYLDLKSNEGTNPSVNFIHLRSICLIDAIIGWSKVLGTNQEETHWKHYFDPVRDGEIRDRITSDLDISDDEYEGYHQILRDLRNQYLVHESYKMENCITRMPTLIHMVQSMHTMYEILREEYYEVREVREYRELPFDSLEIFSEQEFTDITYLPLKFTTD